MSIEESRLELNPAETPHTPASDDALNIKLHGEGRNVFQSWLRQNIFHDSIIPDNLEVDVDTRTKQFFVSYNVPNARHSVTVLTRPYDYSELDVAAIEGNEKSFIGMRAAIQRELHCVHAATKPQNARDAFILDAKALDIPFINSARERQLLIDYAESETDGVECFHIEQPCEENNWNFDSIRNASAELHAASTESDIYFMYNNNNPWALQYVKRRKRLQKAHADVSEADIRNDIKEEVWDRTDQFDKHIFVLGGKPVNYKQRFSNAISYDEGEEFPGSKIEAVFHGIEELFSHYEVSRACIAVQKLSTEDGTLAINVTVHISDDDQQNIDSTDTEYTTIATATDDNPNGTTIDQLNDDIKAAQSAYEDEQAFELAKTLEALPEFPPEKVLFTDSPEVLNLPAHSETEIVLPLEMAESIEFDERSLRNLVCRSQKCVDENGLAIVHFSPFIKDTGKFASAGDQDIAGLKLSISYVPTNKKDNHNESSNRFSHCSRQYLQTVAALAVSGANVVSEHNINQYQIKTSYGESMKVLARSENFSTLPKSARQLWLLPKDCNPDSFLKECGLVIGCSDQFTQKKREDNDEFMSSVASDIEHHLQRSPFVFIYNEPDSNSMNVIVAKYDTTSHTIDEFHIESDAESPIKEKMMSLQSLCFERMNLADAEGCQQVLAKIGKEPFSELDWLYINFATALSENNFVEAEEYYSAIVASNKTHTELDILSMQLHLAICKEDFEAAASLRDRIEQLHSEPIAQ